MEKQFPRESLLREYVCKRTVRLSQWLLQDLWKDEGALAQVFGGTWEQVCSAHSPAWARRAESPEKCMPARRMGCCCSRGHITSIPLLSLRECFSGSKPSAANEGRARGRSWLCGQKTLAKAADVWARAGSRRACSMAPSEHRRLAPNLPAVSWWGCGVRSTGLPREQGWLLKIGAKKCCTGKSWQMRQVLTSSAWNSLAF